MPARNGPECERRLRSNDAATAATSDLFDPLLLPYRCLDGVVDRF